MKGKLNLDKVLEIDENTTVIFIQEGANSKWFLCTTQEDATAASSLSANPLLPLIIHVF